MTDIKKFGERVKIERERLNLSQEKLSGRLGGGNRSRISAWEGGKLKEFPSVEVLDALAGIFSCDIDYLVGKQDLPRKSETDICAATGLSKEAAKVLVESKELRGAYSIDFCSRLIESKEMWINITLAIEKIAKKDKNKIKGVDNPITDMIWIEPSEEIFIDAGLYYYSQDALTKFIEKIVREKRERGAENGNDN